MMIRGLRSKADEGYRGVPHLKIMSQHTQWTQDLIDHHLPNM